MATHNKIRGTASAEYLNTRKVTTTVGEVHNQIVQLSGADEKGDYHDLGVSEFGNLKVNASDPITLSVLQELLKQQEITNKYLRIISGFDLIDTDGDL